MAKKETFNAPFAAVARELKKKMEAQEKAPPPPPPPPPPRAREPDEDLSFAELMGEVPARAVDPRGPQRVGVTTPGRREAQAQEEAEALATLASTVDSGATLVSGPDEETLEGWVEGLDRKVLRNLRRGDHKVEATLDLHGQRQEQARGAVERFVTDARDRGVRTVRIIHGRGNNSEDHVPVIKNALGGWLARGRCARHILAFCPAAPHDGGAGAVYVLLRR